MSPGHQQDSHGKTTNPITERICAVHLLLLWKLKHFVEAPESSIPTGGPVLRCQSALQYRGDDESEQAIIFGQEAYPKFIHKTIQSLYTTLK